MACTEAYATVQDYLDFFCIASVGAELDGRIERFLEMAAADIHGARAQSGGCDCTLAAWATEMLKKLNCTIAAAHYNCTCGSARLSDDDRAMLGRWSTAYLTQIRTGHLELCDGETGADWPAGGAAERNLTVWNEIGILRNRWLREA